MSYQGPTPRTAVLKFYGDSPRGHVRHGNFWTPSTNLGLCFWEAWIKPDDNPSKYLISDGYGGSHALLAGFTQSAPGAVCLPSGNMYTGSTTVGFGSDEGVYPGEWCHVAWAWATDPAQSSAKFLFCYVNGIPVGYVSQNSTRQAPAIVAGGGCDLFVGGSDHSNYKGLLAMLRGFESSNPLTNPQLGFTPDNTFGAASYDNAGAYTDAAFVASYMCPGMTIIPDLSNRGFGGVDFTGTLRRHAGSIFGCEDLGVARGMPASGVSTFPRPGYVYDDTCPCGSSALTVPTLDVPAASPIPVGARIFDDFNRTQQNFAWQATPSLGATKAGASLGALTWTPQGLTAQGVSAPVFGIRDGRGVYLGQTIGACSVVDNGSATQDIRVDRRVGGNGVDGTGIAFRVQDRDNFWFAYVIPQTSTSGAAPTVQLGGYTSGSYTLGFNNYATTGSWTRLRVVASGTTITVYTGVTAGTFDANGFPDYTWTQIGQLTGQTGLQSATKCGIAGLPYNATLITNMYRFDNFEVR